MARALDRPRIVPAPTPAPTPAEPAESGDLFEHFGVALEPRVTSRPRPLVEVAACGRCGWWVRAGEPLPCPVCGAPVGPESR